ncbi:MAG: type II secretion system protein [Patescibacteria group bacterium]
MIKSGFSIIELIIVMGITITLFAIASFSFIKPQQKANIDGVVNVLIADIKTVQTKAMLGNSQSDFTIRFDTNSYTLDGYTVNLSENVKIKDITFFENKLVFQKGSGEHIYSGNQNSLVISTESGDEPVQIIVNKYGAVHTN